MDPEFNRRLESKDQLRIYQYLKDAYCNGAESVGNVISLSRRTSFIMGLKGLLDGLCGSEDPSVIIANSLLVTYSKFFYIFKNNKSEEFRMILGKLPHTGYLSTSLPQSTLFYNSLPNLILYVMGAYPNTSFHLFPLLLKEPRSITLPLNTSIFPALSFKSFVDERAIQGAANGKNIPFSSSIAPLYSKYLQFFGTPKNNVIEVHPFDYFILRYLHCIHYLNVSKVYSFPVIQQIQNPTKETGSILAIQLFIHYMTYLIDPSQPSKPMITNSPIPSIARPDLFFLHSICELWLNRDSRIANDWFLLFKQSHIIQRSRCNVQQPSKAMIACLSEFIKHLALSPSLLSEGTSVFDNEFGYSLFYYFAKEFAFFSIETLKPYHATFSEVVYCWTLYLQPWLFTKKTPTDYKAFIQRHYLFYRGLLLLVIKRLTVFPLNSDANQKGIIESLTAIQKVFTKEVLQILRMCDSELKQIHQTRSDLSSASMYKGDCLTEGIHYLKLTTSLNIFSLNRMIDEESVHCLLTKLCQCYLRLTHFPEYKNEKFIILFLGELFEYEPVRFKEYYESIQKEFQPSRDDSYDWTAIFAPFKEFLFSTLATQTQRYLPRLTDPITQYEIPLLVHVGIRLTILINTIIYCIVHVMDGTREGMNWDAYFDDPLNCYINLRWFADSRNLFWSVAFVLFCWFIYWIGIHL